MRHIFRVLWKYTANLHLLFPMHASRQKVGKWGGASIYIYIYILLKGVETTNQILFWLLARFQTHSWVCEHHFISENNAVKRGCPSIWISARICEWGFARRGVIVCDWSGISDYIHHKKLYIMKFTTGFLWLDHSIRLIRDLVIFHDPILKMFYFRDAIRCNE